VLVSEEQILAAMRRVHDAKGWIMEGAAAVAMAALEQEISNYAGKNVVVVICGGNVSPEVLRRVQSAPDGR
jgi:threonine dehydratase